MSLYDEQMLEKHEGVRLFPYRCSAGKLTIGIGRNLEDNGIRKEEALFMLRNDIADVRGSLEKFAWFTILDPVRQSVLVNMGFNLGMPKLMGFRNTIRAISDQDYLLAADELLRSAWAHQVGKRAQELAGLMRKGGDV